MDKEYRNPIDEAIMRAGYAEYAAGEARQVRRDRVVQRVLLPALLVLGLLVLGLLVIAGLPVYVWMVLKHLEVRGC